MSSKLIHICTHFKLFLIVTRWTKLKIYVTYVTSALKLSLLESSQRLSDA